MDASNNSMKLAMREALASTGRLDAIKAQLRAVVFHALDASTPDSKAKPPQTPEQLLVNELIREYLEFSGFEHTLAVFRAEASLPAAVLPRSILAAELGYPGAPQTPLLYSVVAEGKAFTDQSSDPR